MVSLHNIIIYVLTICSSFILGKSDGEEGLSSDHIINGPRLLYVLLTMVFNSMLIHGVSPKSMLVGTMIPIPKDRRQLMCSLPQTTLELLLLSCVQTDFCRITMSGKVSDLPTRFKRALFRQKKLDRINFRSGKSSTKCTRCPHWSVGVTRCWSCA